MAKPLVEVPKELLWDYEDPPEDLLWRLRRIAEFFPRYGLTRETLDLLFEHRHQLRVESGMVKLIEEYHRAWEAKE